MKEINPNLIKLAEQTHNPDLKIDENILKKSKPKSIGKTNTNFSLEDLKDFYRINGINYREGTYTVDLLKNLLDNGNRKTQDGWVEYSQKAQQNNEFYVGDLPLYFAIKHSLYQNRNGKYQDKIENVRKFIKQQMFSSSLITLTRINYNKLGKDKAIHNYKTSDQYELFGDIAGLEGEIINSETNTKSALGSIIGNNDINEVNKVYKWLTEHNACLHTIDSKQDDECIVGFTANSMNAFFLCYGILCYKDRSLGIRATKIKKSK